eukprot:2111025-Rhodomonas_salina.1
MAGQAHRRARVREGVTNILQLDDELLSAMWPAERVVLGTFACSRLQSVLEKAGSATLTVRHLPNVEIAPATLARFAGKVAFSSRLSMPPGPVQALAAAAANGWHRVVSLDMRQNGIGTDGAARLAVVLSRFALLEQLLLGGNGIGPVGLGHIASILPYCGELKDLDVGSNQIGDRGATDLAETIRRCSKLQSLNLSSNMIGFEGVTALAPELQKCEQLASLDLRDNQIGDEGVGSLGFSLPAMSALTELRLGHNFISADGAGPPPLTL